MNYQNEKISSVIIFKLWRVTTKHGRKMSQSQFDRQLMLNVGDQYGCLACALKLFSALGQCWWDQNVHKCTWNWRNEYSCNLGDNAQHLTAVRVDGERPQLSATMTVTANVLANKFYGNLTKERQHNRLSTFYEMFWNQQTLYGMPNWIKLEILHYGAFAACNRFGHFGQNSLFYILWSIFYWKKL